MNRIEQLTDSHPDDLRRLYKNEGWIGDRDRTDIDAVIEGSD